MLPASLRLELGQSAGEQLRTNGSQPAPLPFPVGASFTTGDRVGANEDQRDWSSEPDADFAGTGRWGCEGS